MCISNEVKEKNSLHFYFILYIFYFIHQNVPYFYYFSYENIFKSLF